jgi:hypothetical protein
MAFGFVVGQVRHFWSFKQVGVVQFQFLGFFLYKFLKYPISCDLSFNHLKVTVLML